MQKSRKILTISSGQIILMTSLVHGIYNWLLLIYNWLLLRLFILEWKMGQHSRWGKMCERCIYSLLFKTKYYFISCVYLKVRVKHTCREREMFKALVHSPDGWQWPEVDQSKNQGIPSGLSGGCQRPAPLRHLLLCQAWTWTSVRRGCQHSAQQLCLIHQNAVPRLRKTKVSPQLYS